MVLPVATSGLVGRYCGKDGSSSMSVLKGLNWEKRFILDNFFKKMWVKLRLHIVVNYRRSPVMIVTAHLDRGMRGKL